MELGPTWYEASGNPAAVRPALSGTVSADVCVVGAGFTGLSAALHLARAGLKVVVLEARTVGGGASGRNGGQIHSGQRVDQDTLETDLGVIHARLLWDLARESTALVRNLVAEHAIACDLRDGLVHVAWKNRDAPHLRRYGEHLEARYGVPMQWIPRAELPGWIASERYHGGLVDAGGGHIHPLNFVRGLAAAVESAGATIHEHSQAEPIPRGSRPIVIRTKAGEVRCAHAVLACDTWLGSLDPKAGATVLPINSFVLATTPLGEERAKALIPAAMAVSDTKFVVDYYRLTPDHRLLFGGGETYTARYPSDLKAFISKPMLRVFPQLAGVAIEYAWGGAVGITLSRLPHFGWSRPDIAFAHGFSGQGVAIATLAGKLLAEATMGTASRFDVYATLKHTPIPGGRLLRTPLMALGMLWYALRDRL
jgi:gamma-glutamylputrescine oxidase